MAELRGIAASSGIAIAKAFIMQDEELDVSKKPVEDVEAEQGRLETAINTAKEELEAIRDHAKKELGEDKASIFSAHLLVLDDPELIQQVKDKIKSEEVNAEYALNEAANGFITMFEQMDNDYMKERASDLRDVTKRVLGHLLGVSTSNPSMIQEEVVIVANDLTPSDTAQINREYVRGFTTDIGGRTSHSAIMARSMEIPAVVGTKNVTQTVEHGTLLIVDGIQGQVLVDPSDEQINEYKQKQAEYVEQRKEMEKLVNEPSVSEDGHQVELAANIGTVKDVDAVLSNGGEGVGLFRTEFIYMGRNEMPSEEEQYEAYRQVLEQMGDKPVVVRTLDVGGDKELPYLDLPKELNPFLGFRAIRMCLDKQDIFRTQLRALLRASTAGQLKIMFPMVATVEEFRQARELLEEEKQSLQQQGVEVSEHIELGIMVEIPSTALLADVFAKEVDFFSIGTNDLIQYTMAADRMNEQVSYLYQPYHPSILRMIRMVINAAHQEGKWVGMCGEMAGDPVAIPLLLGLGLDEFSMSATSILPARQQIAKLNKADLEPVVTEALTFETAEQVVAHIKRHTNQA
ncbi:phosphoenolpyruvate--protein phosphotransferase [Caldalkalibacillus salinus]|uniref:phosphoenolpyruvate--protein phosphotransferase n=1 Tax=Caldalkalibacillus salinus TaxID=2803787 RepID=UPI00192487E6|nr:phosphoenolpyruvate--protein phosphotransferase [Caldalkalibacillus salinus]